MTVPKLRFKEFDGGWTKSTIQFFMDNNFILDQMDGNHGELYPKSEEFSATGVPYISATDFSFGDVNFATCKRLPIERAKLFKKGIAKNGDVLFAHNATVGPVAILKTDLDFVILSTTATYYRCEATYLNNHYLKNYFESDFFVQQYFGIMSQSTRNQVPITTQRKLNIAVPNIQEQTKIASFLSAVDEKISQLTQKHELLSQYKQGMMQKLFSQQIRFKADDGSEFGEWEEKTLIDSVDTNIKWSFTGGPFGSNLKSEDYTELGIRIIQLQNIGDGAFLNDYKIYTSPEKANELLSCNIYPDEILISKMGDPVARCCIVPKHHDRYVMCSDGIRLVVDKKNYSSIFMFYQINYQDFRQSASDVSTGSTRKRIGLSDLKQLPIKAPCLEEQTKIANFLSAIDQKIEVVAQQIEQAKQWKKGLLQQMFV